VDYASCTAAAIALPQHNGKTRYHGWDQAEQAKGAANRAVGCCTQGAVSVLVLRHHEQEDERGVVSAAWWTGFMTLSADIFSFLRFAWAWLSFAAALHLLETAWCIIAQRAPARVWRQRQTIKRSRIKHWFAWRVRLSRVFHPHKRAGATAHRAASAASAAAATGRARLAASTWARGTAKRAA